jgi:hypothetical protein
MGYLKGTPKYKFQSNISGQLKSYFGGNKGEHAGCQISTLIFEKQIMEGGLYKYPIKNILKTAKFLLT